MFLLVARHPERRRLHRAIFRSRAQCGCRNPREGVRRSRKRRLHDCARPGGWQYLAPLSVHGRTWQRTAVLSGAGQSGRLADTLVPRRLRSSSDIHIRTERRPVTRGSADDQGRWCVWPATGISIRPFDPARAEAELRRIFALSTVAFSHNFLYAPIKEAEFVAQNQALLSFVQPELILLAEQHGRLVGYIFAVPDVLETKRGANRATVILKTVAVDPSVSGIGLGGVLMDHVQRAARRSGYRRAIHALMHETNASRAISSRYARTIRKYAVFSRQLTQLDGLLPVRRGHA